MSSSIVSEEEIPEKYRKKPVGFAPTPNGGFSIEPPNQGTAAFTGGGVESVLDSVLGLPEAVARAGQGLVNIGMDATGNERIMREQGENILPDILPSGRQVLAGADSLAGFLSGNKSPGNRFDSAMANRNAIEEQHPVLDGAGRIGGDALTIATGRFPMRAASGNVPGGLLDDTINKVAENFKSFVARKASGKTGTTAAIKDVVSGGSGFLAELAKGGGRAVETGLEAATLEMLNGEDPMQMMWYAGGAQAASSGLLTLADGTANWPFKIWPKLNKVFENNSKMNKFAVSIGAQALLLQQVMQFGKHLVPGEDSSIYEIEEKSYEKMVLFTMAGLLGVGGKRSKADGLVSRYPALADAFAAVPRAAMINLAQNADEITMRMLGLFMSAPETFTDEQTAKFDQGMKDGDVRAISRGFMRSQKVRDAMDAPRGLEGVKKVGGGAGGGGGGGY